MRKLICILIWVILSLMNLMYAQSDCENPTGENPDVWTYPPIKPVSKSRSTGAINIIESGESIRILIRNLSGRVLIEYTGNNGNPAYLEINVSDKETTVALSKETILPGTPIKVTIKR